MPKMRIQLKDEQGVVLTDRLVEQLTELQTGPKDKHQGHITLELTLQAPEDIALFKTYIDQLAGNLPLKSEHAVSKTTGKVNPYKEIYQDIRSKESMEAVIDYLMSLDFRFVTKQFIEERIQLHKLDPKYDSLPDTVQYLVRLSRVAKDPTNDKYDFNLIFGINIYKQKDKVFIYRDGERFKRLTRSWDNHQANMKTKKVPLVFPKFMTIEERIKWRKIAKYLKDDKPVSQKDNLFYERYKPDIKNIV